jgi:hypothetical protein
MGEFDRTKGKSYFTNTGLGDARFPADSAYSFPVLVSPLPAAVTFCNSYAQLSLPPYTI